MLKGKTAVITGSGRGIGKSIALKLASHGANIVINDIPSSDYADETCEEVKKLGVECIVVKGDVRNTEDVQKLVSETMDKFGHIDIFVNNAGITRDGLMIRMSEDDWDLVMDINLKGAFNCIKAVARPMMKQRSGAIINMASIVGVMGNPGQANYVASQAGLIGLTKTTAKDTDNTTQHMLKYRRRWVSQNLQQEWRCILHAVTVNGVQKYTAVQVTVSRQVLCLMWRWIWSNNVLL